MSKLLLATLKQSLDSIPPELVSIVFGYANEIPHAWFDDRRYDNELPKLKINRDRIVCSQSSEWYRIVSTQSIVTGPRRWQINIAAFGNNTWLVVGITADSDHGIRSSYAINSQPGELFLLTHRGGYSPVVALHNGKQLQLSIRPISRVDSVVSVDVDIDRRIMAVRFDDYWLVRLAVPLTVDLVCCRPCVFVGSAMNAVIGPVDDSVKPAFLQSVDVAFD
jgi:hypothetical protein